MTPTPLFLYAREFFICEIEVRFRFKKYYQCYHQLIKAHSGQEVSNQMTEQLRYLTTK
jgi:hypothetical protein